MTPITRLLISCLPGKVVQRLSVQGQRVCNCCHLGPGENAARYIERPSTFENTVLPNLAQTLPQEVELREMVVRGLAGALIDSTGLGQEAVDLIHALWTFEETYLLGRGSLAVDKYLRAFEGLARSLGKETDEVPTLLLGFDRDGTLAAHRSKAEAGLQAAIHKTINGEFPSVQEVQEAQEAQEEVQEVKEKEGQSDMTMSVNGTTTKLEDVMRAISASEIFKNPVVVREGEKIILPKGMNCRQAIDALAKQEKEEERVVGVDEPIGAFLFEGLYAFQLALSEKFGWVDHVPTPGFFGDTPPTMISIDVDVNKTVRVFWGRIQVPGVDGFLATSYAVKDKKLLFSISGEVKQKSREIVSELAELTKKFVRTNSIYKGKALKYRAAKTDKENLEEAFPRFIDTSGVDPTQLIFSKEVYEQVQTSLFNPVEYTEFCRQKGISLKRGTLLSGRYGVGKSLAASVLSKKCVDNGWTFFYLDNANDIVDAIHMAKMYQPAVIFAEDIDKVVSGQRNAEMDKVLNTLDGVDTKNSEIMVVFTTNDMANIHEAMRRAKRLDSVIEVLPPDQESVKRLIVQYTRGNLSPDSTLGEVSKMLEGQIPATIQEVCERAQLSAIGRVQGGPMLLSDSDLKIAARTMLNQINMLQVPKPKEYGDSVEKAAETLGNQIGTGVAALLSMAGTHQTNGQPRPVPALPGS